MKSGLLAAMLVVSSGCGSGVEPAALGVRIQALGGALPSDLAKLRVTYRIGDDEPLALEATLEELDQQKRRLTLDALPSDTALTLDVQGIDRAGQVAYAGSVGPLMLGPREQLKLPVTLYARSRSEAVPASVPPARFLHSATRLEDGRVLIAGGFGAPTALACPAELPDGSLCVHVSALRDAWTFEPSSARFSELPDGMLSPRAGHSATVLPNGQVLVAGGATEATLVLLHDADGSFEPRWLAVDAEGKASSLASFELFDAWPSARSEQRNPARGRFVGPPGAEHAPGTLERRRFLHGAAAGTVHPEHVILAGGDEPDSARSCEIFAAERKGGAGVLALVSMLEHPRRTPAVVALRAGDAGFVWLFGGGAAHSNAELADRWFASTRDARGSLATASESAFPNLSHADATERASYAFSHPLAVALGPATHAFVTGGLGLHCDGAGAPSFAGGAACTGEKALSGGFLTDARTGSTQPVQLSTPHVLGAASSLPDGSAMLSGGFADLTFTAHAAVHVLRLAAPLTIEERSLVAARALHTSTSFGPAGVLTFGGVVLHSDTLELVTTAEVLWL